MPSEDVLEEEDAGTSRVLFSSSITRTLETYNSNLTLDEILGRPASSSRTISRQKKTSSGDIARDLFGTADIIGSNKTGGSGEIKIYTDTNARMPEYDPSPDNPFIDHPVVTAGEQVAKAQRLEKKYRKSREEFERARAGRDDGMVYNLYDRPNVNRMG